MAVAILSLLIKFEHEVVAARQRARQVAGLLGFDPMDQTRIATAVSEIARNAFNDGGGRVEFLLEGTTVPQVFIARITDIARTSPASPGARRGEDGWPARVGVGVMGARRLMDQFEIDAAPEGGTRVWLKKLLPRRAPLIGPKELASVARALARERPLGAMEEIQQQNQELLETLDELRGRQEELSRLNAELEDTNRGVVALYAELDEKADHLRRADDMKSRFLSNMSHEFRTPLNSVLALSRLLLDRGDGDLSKEQEVQIGYIRKAAEDLSELVNDLLDLAKVEAGKIVIRPAEFEVANLFGALRGMLRPLLVNESVALVFEDTHDLPPLDTDEAKVSQILRNFISNALKFTERGEVRVSASLGPAGDTVVFTVADTGIGIAPEDHGRIFQEFGQLDNPVQRKVRGTGLGLPLTKKLVGLLGGSISVQSQLGAGSTFAATIPIHYAEPQPLAPALQEGWRPEPGRTPILVLEDSPEDFLLYEKYLRGTTYQPVHALTTRQARDIVGSVRPAAIVLDILLRGEDSWPLLTELKRAPTTQTIPILVVTTVEDQAKGLTLGADAYAVKPVRRAWLLETLAQLTQRRAGKRVLVIDDDETVRYLVRGALKDTGLSLAEATTGSEGLQRAQEERPDAIVLDLVLPGMSGFDVLERLKAEPGTRDIPVVIMTSMALQPPERTWLSDRAVAVLSKASPWREQVRAELELALGPIRAHAEKANE